jgi:aspartyl-tRNA(Asn)/glutamyl-tRNA(Gln) amidotransferase subunit A
MTAPDSQLWQSTAVGIAARVRSGALAAERVLDSVAQRMASVDPDLHAFCTPSLDEARAAARALDERIRRGEAVGPLAGVPVGVKDLIATKGLRTTSGSLAYLDFVPDEDDVVVERLRAADALIVGKTNASEFGYGAVGQNLVFPATRNPWDLTRTPGGSSAGSAAAVAAGIVPVAIGSDGGGSIRIPAALCGLYGIKPSMGRVPLYPGCRDERYPGVSSWESVEHLGPITRTVADAALVLSVICGPDARDRHSIPCDDVDWAALRRRDERPWRIAFSPDLGYAQVDAEVLSVVEEALVRIEDLLGAPVARLALDWPAPQPQFGALIALETDLRGMRAMRASGGPELFGPGVERVLEQPWTAEDFTDAIVARKAAANRMWRLMRGIDILLTPTVAITAYPVGFAPPRADWTPFSAIANLTGQPAASSPIGLAGGLPVGLQAIGAHLGDQDVLAFGALLEREFGAAPRPPAYAA